MKRNTEKTSGMVLEAERILSGAESRARARRKKSNGFVHGALLGATLSGAAGGVLFLIYLFLT